MSWWKRLFGGGVPEQEGQSEATPATPAASGDAGAVREIIAWLDTIEIPSILYLEIEHDHDPEYLDAWFALGPWSDDGTSFEQIAHDGSGGMWMRWRYPGLVGPPPIVFLGSDGERGLVAPDLRAWVLQLGSGQSWDAYHDSWSPIDDDYEDELPVLRAAIHAQFGAVDMEPGATTAEARKAHPDFAAWVERIVAQGA